MSRAGFYFLSGLIPYGCLAWAVCSGPAPRPREAAGFPDGPARAVIPFSVESLEEYAQDSGDDQEGGSFQRIVRRGGTYSVAYGFNNFNRDELSIQVEMPGSLVTASMEEFGIRSGGLEALDAWYQKAQKEAIEDSKARFFSGRVTAPTDAELQQKLSAARRRNAEVQAALDRTLEDLTQEYRSRRLELYASAGFRLKDERTVTADIPNLVRKNARRMAPVSLAFARIASGRDYGSGELVGAVTAMAQTAMRYEIPQSLAGGKILGGVLPPPKSFVLGQGDCDTKTALLGSILYNWPNLRLVGLAIPEHYLLGVHQIPAKGDVYVEYEGLAYIMVEAAGPAWLPPGRVGDFTQEYLASSRLFTVESFH